MAFGGGASDEFSEINITPLTDVFLILFLIMIVIAPMLRESALKINPPIAKHGQAAASAKNKVINLEISEEGLIAINGKKLAEEPLLPEQVEPQVTARLREIIADEAYKEAPVNIIADSETKQKFVVGAMDAAAGLGLKKMNIVTVSNVN